MTDCDPESVLLTYPVQVVPPASFSRISLVQQGFKKELKNNAFRDDDTYIADFIGQVV